MSDNDVLLIFSSWFSCFFTFIIVVFAPGLWNLEIYKLKILHYLVRCFTTELKWVRFCTHCWCTITLYFFWYCSTQRPTRKKLKKFAFLEKGYVFVPTSTRMPVWNVPFLLKSTLVQNLGTKVYPGYEA